MTIWKTLSLSTSVPKYIGLADALAQAIASGQLPAGSKLPTHRALADDLQVTVGTVTRAYREAEQRQLIEGRVGSGTFVKDNSGSADFYHGENSAPTHVDLSYSLALNQGQAEMLAEQLRRLSNEPQLLHQLLAYQQPEGIARHREAGVKWLESTGISTATMDRLLVTNGGQHGFQSAISAVCKTGDTVLSAGMTYPGFILVAQQMGLRHIGLDSDAQGILPQSLRLAAKRYRPKALYLNTRLNNPSAETMSADRIHELAQIAEQEQIWIIEDDVMGCLMPAETPAFANFYPHQTLFITSTSKSLVGGLRVGYLSPPAELKRRVAAVIRASGWMSPPLMVELASRWIEDGTIHRLMSQQRTAIKARQDTVKKYLGQWRYSSHPCSPVVWLFLPEPRRSQEFCQSLAERQVLVKPSTAFAAGHFNAPQAIRFCLAGDTSQTELEKALAIIADELTQLGPCFDIGQ